MATKKKAARGAHVWVDGEVMTAEQLNRLEENAAQGCALIEALGISGDIAATGLTAAQKNAIKKALGIE